jgi:DedD protein
MSETPDTKSFRIEYRHLAFLFLGAVCICAVFFSLGFVVGRAQAFETALKNQEVPKSTADTGEDAPSASGGSLSADGRVEPPGVGEAGKAGDAGGTAGADYRKDLDFYSAVKEPKVEQNFHPDSPKPARPATAANKSPSEQGKPSASKPARNGPVSLQVAALKSSAEAGRLAKTLRSKGYPVFIVNPAKEDPNELIRVQIGPYTSDAEAAKVKARLGTEGYTAISKR